QCRIWLSDGNTVDPPGVFFLTCVSFMRVILESAMKLVLKRKDEMAEKPASKRRPTLDEMLDEALGKTFPASDPVALTQPSKTTRTTEGSRKLRARKGT